MKIAELMRYRPFSATKLHGGFAAIRAYCRNTRVGHHPQNPGEPEGADKWNLRDSKSGNDFYPKSLTGWLGCLPKKYISQ